MRQLQAEEAAATQIIDAGTFTGTWGFAAPEQMRGQTQPGSDLYGLGATLVYLFSGLFGLLSQSEADTSSVSFSTEGLSPF